MNVSVPKETAAGERRVALVPEVVDRLVKSGVEVVVEAGAGAGAHEPDSAYEAAGAAIGDGFSGDVVAKVAPPNFEEIGRLSRGGVLVGFLQPLTAADTVRALADAGVTSSPWRRSRGSRARNRWTRSRRRRTVTGYMAALIAAQELPRFFPMLTTAAGTIAPAKVLMLGAGVAGLQAIATARRLGAAVQAFDVRPAVKEQVESLGARSWAGHGDGGRGGRGRLRSSADRGGAAAPARAAGRGDRQMDVVISTAAVPGRQAPVLVTEAGGRHEPGSVIVDMAAESGGNCELTQPGGPWCEGRDDRRPARARVRDVRSTPVSCTRATSSRWSCMVKGGRLRDRLRRRDHRGRVRHSATCQIVPARRPGRSAPAASARRRMDLLTELDYVFVLACSSGFEVISKVPDVLHTPLMSGTNAIHGIVMIGGVLLLGRPRAVAVVLGASRSWPARPTCWVGSWSPTACSRCSRPASRAQEGAGLPGAARAAEDEIVNPVLYHLASMSRRCCSSSASSPEPPQTGA